MVKTIRTGHWLAILLLGTAIAQGADPRLGFTLETLDNGLRVVYVPNSGGQVVHLRMIYHVGSRDEDPQRQGFAHLFEHMMFRGSAHVGDQEFADQVLGVGGTYNGSTERDLTSYVQTLPSNQLAMGLYLEADRMAGFQVTDQLLQIERNVVIQELARRANVPEFAISDEIPAMVFQTHPYRWSTGGSPEHLHRAQLHELQQFFDRYYIPNNALLVIVGRFNPDEARRLVREYFSWIPRGREIVRSFPREPIQAAAQTREIERMIPEPMFVMALRAPAAGSEDEAAAMVLARAIEARLKNYLEYSNNPQCSNTFARLEALGDDGYIYLGAELLPGADMQTVQRIINVQLNLLREDGVMLSERDFASWMDDFCSEILRQRLFLEGIASQVGRGIALTGQADATDRLIDRLRRLTAPMVFDAAQKFLRPEARNTLIVRPRRAEQTASASIDPRPSAPLPTSQPARIAFPAAFPNKPPIASDIELFHSAAATEFLANDVRIMLLPEREPGKVGIDILLPRGRQDDPVGKEGMSQLTLALVLGMAQRPQRDLNAGTWLHSPFEFYGACDWNHTSFGASAPISQADLLMRGINSALSWKLEAGLLDSQLVTLQWKLYNDSRTQDQQGEPTAILELRRAIFGDSFLGRRPSVASLRAVTRSEMDEFRRNLFDLRGATLIFTGNISIERARSLVATMLSDWPAPLERVSNSPAVVPAVVSANGRPRVILIDDPNAHHAIIRIGSPAFGWGSDQRPAADLGERILSRRMSRIIRSAEGYAYTAEAEFDQYQNGGLFRVQTETSFANIGSTLTLLVENIQRMSGEAVSESELEKAKIAYANLLGMTLQTPQAQAAWRAIAMQRGEVADVIQDIQRARRTRAEEIQALFGKYAGANQLVIVVVAPAGLAKSQLEAFGEIEVRPMPSLRPGASTQPAHIAIPRPM